MCGIAGIFNIKIQSRELRNKALRMARKIRHRGPDWSGMYCGGSAILAHERLFIVDPQSGSKYWRLTAKSITTVTSAPNMPAATSSGPGVTVR